MQTLMSSVCEARWSDGSDALRLILGRECWSNSIEDRICERDQQSYTALHTHSERHTHIETHTQRQTHAQRHTNTHTQRGRRFYPKRLTVHSGYTFFFFCEYMCSLGIEPTTFALLTQCSTTEPQEHMYSCTHTHRDTHTHRERDTQTHTERDTHAQRETHTHRDTSLKL